MFLIFPELLLNQASYPSFIHGLCLPIGNLSGSFMDKAKTGGYSVLTYSCNTPEQATKALDLGADVIMTDNPGMALRLFEKGNLMDSVISRLTNLSNSFQKVFPDGISFFQDFVK